MVITDSLSELTISAINKWNKNKSKYNTYEYFFALFLRLKQLDIIYQNVHNKKMEQ